MRKTVAYAFHHSIPILIGFFPVGLAYGLLMQQAGYNFLWSGACSLFVLAGSLQFLMVTFFAGGVSLATVAVLALLLNSRHIFYGLSFIDKFRSFGPWRWFLIYSLCDENYSLHCSHDFGPDVNEKWAYVLTAALVTFYWVALSMLGGLVGSLIPFDTTGIDFALTALFTVIVVDQLRGARTRIPAAVAAVSSIGALLLLGSATPTVETMYYAREGRYQVFPLYRRYNEKALPEVFITDLRDELRAGNETAVSEPLRSALEENLARGEQSILFLNRRGSSRMLLCGECGEVPECPRCSVPMTYHSANGRLMCHYCGHSEPAYERCPQCGGIMKHIGTGTHNKRQGDTATCTRKRIVPLRRRRRICRRHCFCWN